MFVWIRNSSADDIIMTLDGRETVPMGWFWERMVVRHGEYVWISVSLFLNFFFYLFGSVVEFAAWVLYETGDASFAEWYFSRIGYWMSCVFYFFPPLFAAV